MGTAHYTSHSQTVAADTITLIDGDVQILQPSENIRVWFGPDYDDIATLGLKIPAEGWAEPWKFSKGEVRVWCAVEVDIHIVR